MTPPHEGSPHGQRLLHGDVSRQGPDSSGEPSQLSERALIHGYRATAFHRRIEKCACGGEIEADATPAAVRNAVELHNETTEHRQWQNWRGDW